ncbi:glycoside hydrolase family 13 protein [Schizopora paradoxa]|uniref:Glycoside hydrolase family 13 protein n=1 Tax=Schizopora paradoxa TaxID=27342 RepID=A0A0H2S008_9AGAM|nr:glycoside hydrolase family 13 protein [Schizopora paradoxa]
MDYLRRLRWFSSSLFPTRGYSTPALEQMHLMPQDTKDNPLMFQFFTWLSEGSEQESWWKHFEAQVPRLKEFGVTHVWLPPPNKASNKHGAGYDAYDLWDLGEFEQKGSVATRWGSKEELQQACAVARANNIGVLIDAVLGHKLGADRKETFTAIPVNPDNRLQQTGPQREIEGWTAYDFPGRGDKYSTLKWSHRHFTGVDWDARERKSDIYYIIGPGRNGWSKHVDDELGNYDYLLGCDIDHTQPDVKEDLLRWGEWILEQTGGAGFRFDAMKHFDRRFLAEFIERCRRSLGSRDMFAVSEYWSDSISKVEHYIKQIRGQTSFFDVPFHYNLHNASRNQSTYDLRKILKKSLLERRPWDAVTFVDNHDTGIGRTLESWVDESFKVQAYALILLRLEGLPCVYYGDVYPNKEHFDANVSKQILKLIQARKKYAYGKMTEYLNYRNCIGFVRHGDDSHEGSGCVVVIRSNIDVKQSSGNSKDYGQEIRMKVDLKKDLGTTGKPVIYRDLLGDSRTVAVNAEGWGIFPCAEGSAAVWTRSTSEE